MVPKHTLITCLFSAALCACATEVESLTHIQASLEFEPGRAPVQFSYLPDDRGADPADELEIRFDGQPIVLGSHAPLSVNSKEAMISLYLPAGSGRFEFVRGGEVLLTSEPVRLEAERLNYVIVHGAPDALDVLVLAADYEARRLNVANLRIDRQDIAVDVLDETEAPLQGTTVLAYGETWSELPPLEATYVRVTSGQWHEMFMIPCNPKIAMISFDMPWSAEHYMSPQGIIGLMAPTEPGSPEADAEDCYEPTCDCP